MTRKLNPWDKKTIPGVFVGCHVQPGGLWSGDYLVSNYSPFKKACDVVKSKAKIHRVKRCWKTLGKFVFPVAERRKERLLKDEDFDAPDELPDLVDTSDDEGAGLDRGATGSSSKGEVTTPPTSSRMGLSSNRATCEKRCTRIRN